MFLHNWKMGSFQPKAGLLVVSAVFVPFSQLAAIDIIEDFNGTELDTAVWENTGPKTQSVTDGALIFNDDGGDWGSGDISVERLDDNGVWQLEADELEATGETHTEVIPGVTGPRGIFRIIEE